MPQPSEVEEVRMKLAAAWRAVGNRLLEEGYSAADVTATMLSVAVASWSGLREPREAAKHLRALADRIEQYDGALPTDEAAA